MLHVFNKVSTLIIIFACFGYANAAFDTDKRSILFIGDSLSAGYGIDPDLAFPALIQQKLIKEFKTPIKVVNGSISGSTTASGLSRLSWYERSRPEIVVVALGANDGLRGIPVSESRKNLKSMITKIKSWGATVILVGMRLPPNYGLEYTADFENMFKELSNEEDLILVPFLLEGVGGEPDLNIADGIHPNIKGHQIMANTVYPYIKDAL